MILDASALLAFLFDEAGSEVVANALLDGAEMTAVNYAEVLTRYVLGEAFDEVAGLQGQLPISIVPVDQDLAYRAAMMASNTRKAGLSLGDRICLALAQRTKDTVLTADRAWRGVAASINVDVALIR